MRETHVFVIHKVNKYIIFSLNLLMLTNRNIKWITSATVWCFQKYSCVFISVQNCGNFPDIENAVAQQTSQYYLIYRCQHLYSLVGPETVKCISSGMWSDLPECRGINTSMMIIFKHLLKRWGEILIWWLFLVSS